MGIVAEAHSAKILGSGEQVVVLNHGFGTDQSVWKHLVSHLVQEYRVVLYDNMGAGTTNPYLFDFTRHRSIDGYVLNLLSLLDELEVESCIYVGHSAFAMVGAIASISRPDLVSKIIMLSGIPRLLKDIDYDGGIEREDLDQLYEAMKSNYKAWCEGFAPLTVGADMGSEAVQELSRTLFNIRPDIALCIAHLKFECDTREILPYIKVPCHILNSSQDLVVPVTGI